MGVSKIKIVIGVAVLIGALAIALLVTTIVLGVRLKNKSNELKELLAKEAKICSTPECVKAAADIIKAMDPSVDPCDDFYQFSCGTWLKTNPIPDTYSSWNQFNLLREQLSRNVREILESDVSQSDPNPLRLAKQFYNSCMGQDAQDESELHDLIEVKLVIEDAPNNLTAKLGQLRRLIGGAFFANMYVELDEENALKYIIYVDQPSLGLSRPFLVDTNHSNRVAYRDLIEIVWPLVYPTYTENYNFTTLADEIVDFESKIAEISAPPEDRRNRTQLYNLMSLREFGEHTGNESTMIDWEVYVTEVFQDVVANHNIDLGPLPDLKVVVRDKLYFAAFGRILQDTNPDIIVNYLRWRLIFGLGNDVSNRFRDYFFDFTRRTQGTLYPSPMWKICSDKANSNFGMAISYRYVLDAFSGDFQEQMAEMIDNIQTSVYDIIDSVDWISSQEIRDKAKVKADKMKEFVGYPDWLFNNDTALDAHYKGLLLSSPQNHFQNILDISYWRNMESLRKIQEAKDISRWLSDPTVVNAFYSSTYNSITFPAGILQPPFYFTGKPIQALNYGGIGMVIGHEISHGFDDRGRQSDGDGNLVNWWDEGTISAYVTRAECFVDQYSQYQVEEVNNTKLNGRNTLGENIADNGGLRQSYNAYLTYTNTHGVEPFLPGLDYSPQQLFFLAFAQIWCGSYTPQGMENQIKTGAHSPNRFRVQGVLENSVEFAQTWNCPVPDENKMCKIW